jgi:hypothetical protein
VSPATAKTLTDFPLVDTGVFNRLVRRGTIREAAPGTFYVYRPEPEPLDRSRFVKTLVFWLIILLIPIVLIQFTG